MMDIQQLWLVAVALIGVLFILVTLA